MLFIDENIKSAWRATSIWFYILEKILSVCVTKQSYMPIKKHYIRFAFKTLLSSHEIHQLARESHLNAQDKLYSDNVTR